MSAKNEYLMQNKVVMWSLLGLITIVGAYLRLAGLDRVGIPGDELEIWRICSQATSVTDILSGNVKGSVMSLLPVCVEFVQNTFSLELDSFCLRFPGAMMGTLSIVVVFLIGRLVYGPVAGIMAATLFALCPVHIQCSREVYPYIVSVAGSVLMLWVTLSLAFRQCSGESPGLYIYPVFLLGLVLMIHSSVASWPLGLLFSGVSLGLVGWKLLRPPRKIWPVAVLLIIFCAIALPRFWEQVVAQLASGSVKHGRASAYTGLSLFDPMGFRFFTNFAWGGTPIRLIYTLGVIVSAIAVMWIDRKRRILLLLPALLLTGFLATMVSRYMTGNPFYPRFLVPILPMYTVLIAGALAFPIAHAHRIGIPWRPGKTIIALLPFAVAVGLIVYPAHLSASMTGRPAPYLQIVEWADATLPPGTPVLCDRYFDPWNEYKVNAPTSVVFMATIPNEPLERYQQAGWRDSAIAFFRDNPDAAFYETKMFWNKLGPWDWPHSFFVQKQTFVDDSFLELSRLGLNYRAVSSSYPREWLPKTIYYNAPEDLARAAQKAGKRAFAVFGENWQYMKVRDFSDWRVMRDSATVTIMNVTGENLVAHLKIVGLAPQQAKQVRVGDRAVTFPANKPIDAGIGPFELQPGRNVISLRDPSWSRQQVPLMVKRLSVEVVESD